MNHKASATCKNGHTLEWGSCTTQARKLPFYSTRKIKTGTAHLANRLGQHRVHIGKVYTPT